MVVSAANSAARKRTRTSDQGPRAVEDQAVQAAPRPGGPDSDEHGSELRANADSTSNGLAAVDLDEADIDSEADFDDLDADDADFLFADADELFFPNRRDLLTELRVAAIARKPSAAMAR